MNIVADWLTGNYIEIFGAVAGVIYVFLEIRQNIWLWPVGIITSAVYIWVFFTGKLYADMGLQGYYVVISILGWYWWVKGAGRRAQGEGEQSKTGRGGEEERGRNEKIQGTEEKLAVSHISMRLALILTLIFVIQYFMMWFTLDRLTDSPVPGWDAFITSLSIIATWMLARKIFEHWYLWIIVNAVAVILFLTRGLYPTVVLYAVYCIMSFIGLREWRKEITK